MPGRDTSGGAGRSDEDRLRDLAARERARGDGKRPPPSFGPSTRAGREHAAATGRPDPTPRPPGGSGRPDATFDFDFARPSTRAAGAGVAAQEPAAQADPDVHAGIEAGQSSGADTATATVDAPLPLPEPEPEPTRPVPQPRRPRDKPGRAPRGPSARASAKASAPAPSGSRGLLARARRDRVGLVLVAVSALLLIGVVAIALGGDGDPAEPKQAAAKPKAPSPYGTPTPTALPPESRVVAYTGAPQAEELGILGTMPFERAADRLERQSVPYDRPSRPVLPAFDLIATIANADPGPGGKYRTRQSGKVIARYLRAARRHDAALILDVQPGTSNFVDEVKPLEKWLKEPDVHLALDPEWRMRPGVQPGTEIGWVSAGEVTATLNRVARIVRANDLPPKMVLVHRFTDGMIKDLEMVDVPKEVVGVISIDGVGTRTQKIHTYDRIAPTLPKPWLPGFKLFYVEDKAAGGMLSGKQTMALKPRPHVVLYE